jgi:hypothetical protein
MGGKAGCPGTSWTKEEPAILKFKLPKNHLEGIGVFLEKMQNVNRRPCVELVSNLLPSETEMLQLLEAHFER